MFDIILNQPLHHYVWELGVGKFNSFFKKFIHRCGMLIVVLLHFTFLLATELQNQKKKKKKKQTLYATIIKLDF